MKATILQAAVALIVIGVLIALAGVAPRHHPAPVTTWRPATEQEWRQHEIDQLSAELDRLQDARR